MAGLWKSLSLGYKNGQMVVMEAPRSINPCLSMYGCLCDKACIDRVSLFANHILADFTLLRCGVWCTSIPLFYFILSNIYVDVLPMLDFLAGHYVKHWLKKIYSMASTASLDSIVFFQDKKRQIRVYFAYLDEKVIRESCYHQDYGWFVRGDGIVTRNSKSNTPITATRWTDNSGITQVSLSEYYLSDLRLNVKHRFGSYTWTIRITSAR